MAGLTLHSVRRGRFFSPWLTVIGCENQFEELRQVAPSAALVVGEQQLSGWLRRPIAFARQILEQQLRKFR